MPLDAHYLRVFKAVLAECSMSQAAMRLRTSASNVKRIVTALESELGVPLFEREGRGNFQPTSHAGRLDQEIAGFMNEMEALQQTISEIQETGRVLRIGVQRWFFETAWFVRFFNQLRLDTRFRSSFVEVLAGQERVLIESGSFDIYIGVTTPVSKRLATINLPPLAMGLGTLESGFVADDLAALARLAPWGLHYPELRAASRDCLQTIELAGGGIGRQILTAQFHEWTGRPGDGQLRGILSPEPAAGAYDPLISWQPFPLLPALPVRATFLSQHPYGCLEQALQRAVVSLKQHEPSF